MTAAEPGTDSAHGAGAVGEQAEQRSAGSDGTLASSGLAVSRGRRPHRTWLYRVVNVCGERLRRWGWRRPLTVGGIVDQARRATGLSDLGSEAFLAPLTALVESFEDVAETALHPMGRLLARHTLVRAVSNRLLFQHYWGQDPSVLNRLVQRPLYVVGLPRTGTTLLYNLLCQDPRGRPLMSYEALFPVPPLPPASDLRRWQTRMSVWFLNWSAPQLPAVHALEANGPEECTWILQNTFVSPSFLLSAQLTRYHEYLTNLPREEVVKAYHYYADVLRLLQVPGDDRHWVLKSPAHRGALAELMEVIPSACVVQTRRDPREVVGSSCSLFAVSRGLFSDRIDEAALGREVLNLLVLGEQRAQAAAAKYPERLLEIPFEELVAEPIAIVRRIYDHFGYVYSPEMEQGMRAWLAANPRGKRGRHRYSLAEFGLTEGDVLTEFARVKAADTSHG